MKVPFQRTSRGGQLQPQSQSEARKLSFQILAPTGGFNVPLSVPAGRPAPIAQRWSSKGELEMHPSPHRRGTSRNNVKERMHRDLGIALTCTLPPECANAELWPSFPVSPLDSVLSDALLPGSECKVIFLKGNNMTGVVCSAQHLVHREHSVTGAALAAVPQTIC